MKVTLNAVTQPLVLMTDGYTLSPEEYIIYCARVSSPENRLNHETAPKLLKYLIDAGHWSPFEMISIAFEIETSRAIAQQILRHRSFSFQEFSQRYSKVENIEPIELRYQAEKNRQSSTDVCDDVNTKELINLHMNDCQKLYENLIYNGIAKECARMVLPLATQTTIVMHGTLRSWIHFLDQRCDDHAQKEIRLIAEEIRNQLSCVCPWTAEALKWTDLNYQSKVKQIVKDHEQEEKKREDCKYFTCQKDSNDEIAISHCGHPDNYSDTEGNCTPIRCPLNK